LVFSPEPKLIELVGDESRSKTLPVMYPVIPKRTSRHKGSSTGLGFSDEKNYFLDYLISHVSRFTVGERVIQSGDNPIKSD